MNERSKTDLDALAESINAQHQRVRSAMYGVLLDAVQIGNSLSKAPAMDFPNSAEYLRLFNKYGWILSAPSNWSTPDDQAVAADLQFLTPWFSILFEDDGDDE